MKKIIFGTLIALSMLQTVTLQAANLDADQWQNYCKENESRCETAIRLCEQNDQADCDEIRLAFMQEKPIPTSVIHSTSNDWQASASRLQVLQPEFLFRNSADQAAARQERYYSNNSEYAADAATLGVPAATEHGYFAITIDNTCGAACYVLTATAQGGQVNDTGCTSLTLSSTGEKGPPGAEQCWGQ